MIIKLINFTYLCEDVFFSFFVVIFVFYTCLLLQIARMHGNDIQCKFFTIVSHEDIFNICNKDVQLKP